MNEAAREPNGADEYGASSIKVLKGLDVTEGDRRKMLGENAARILSL